MITMKELLQIGAGTLQKAGILEAELDAWYLLSYCMDITKVYYYMNEAKEITQEQAARYRKLVSEREKHRPLQYIIGYQEFMGLQFEVNESVLIPRQDTEILVEKALEYSKDCYVLDLCTGSGCIAISIEKYGQPAKVDASDFSEDALEVARKNSKSNNTSVSFIYSDMWNAITERYDLIVSNPPYIDEMEMGELMPEVKCFEPIQALAGGVDGYDYYRRIAKALPMKLKKDGRVMLEIGCAQAEIVSEMLRDNGIHKIEVIKDLAGLDRVVIGQLA